MKRFFRILARPVLGVVSFLKHCVSDCPKNLKCSTLVASAILNLLLVSALLSGCAHTEQGIATEQQVYSVSTNVIAHLKAVTPFLPTPIGTPMELVLGALSACLAAWNVHQQRTLSSLKKSTKVRESFPQDPKESPTPSQSGVTAKGAPSSG